MSAAVTEVVERLMQTVPMECRSAIRPHLEEAERSKHGRRTILATARKYRGVIAELNTRAATAHDKRAPWRAHGIAPAQQAEVAMLREKLRDSEDDIAHLAHEIAALRHDNARLKALCSNNWDGVSE
jgi:hypothetical protein